MFSPTNFRFIRNAEDPDAVNSFTPGGFVRRATAGAALAIGDFVIIVPGINRAHKTLGSSYYVGGVRSGVVVGGAKTYFQVVSELSAIGVQAAVAGEDVLIMTRGMCWAIADVAGIKAGAPISSGRTTSGRVRGDYTTSFARNAPALQIGTVSNLVPKALNAADIISSGAKGTATASSLAMAALVGTINNGKWGLWEVRVAADGATVTSAAGLLTGTNKVDLTLPVGIPGPAITLGFIIVHPTGAGNFVGGTTALDDATVVPNTEYYDLVGTTAPRGYAQSDGGAAGSALLIELVGHS